MKNRLVDYSQFRRNGNILVIFDVRGSIEKSGEYMNPSKSSIGRLDRLFHEKATEVTFDLNHYVNIIAEFPQKG